MDQSLAAGMGAFKIAREPTMARDPGKGSFHHPSSGQHMEAFRDDRVPVHFHPFGSPDAPDACPGMLDNFEANTEVFLHPSLEGVASIPTSLARSPEGEAAFPPER